MKATAIILVISTLFGSTTLACRCASWGPTLYYDYQNTKDCCYQLNGAFYDGDPNGKEYDYRREGSGSMEKQELDS
ncbi:hypothetical protein DPSP01_010150 [Paraphaeosphaeria sporulosa]